VTRVLPQAHDARPAPRIGRYLVTGRIGKGGMGMVYRGLDPALEREVAVKTLVAEGSFDSDGRRRFEVEARAAARLSHPNIVTVHELGEDRGILFIAMEMLPGADLESLLRSGETLPLAERLDIVAQLCRGLAYAHERGVVHRDIKPSNVRLLDDGTAKIMDFGIAKLGPDHHITKTGMMVGTVHYMSPEQVRGRPLDGRTDVFSAGVILYELLAGERPFKGDDVTAILYKIVNEEPAPLALDAFGELAPKLRAVLDKALAKDAAARYASAAAFAEELMALSASVQRSQPAPPAIQAEGLTAARRALGEGHVEEALARLRGLVAEHPDWVEPRRALRVALREEKRRKEPSTASADGYPELDATFQAALTKRDAGAIGSLPTQVSASAALAPTVLAPSGAPAAPAPAPVSTRPWLYAGGAFLVVAIAAAVVLLRPSGTKPATQPPPAAPAAAASAAPRPVASEPPAVATRSLPVRTQPPGAKVTLDGAAVAGLSPLELALDPGVEHKVALALDGYTPQEIRVKPGSAPAALEVTLEKQLPPGTVAVQSEYALDVVWRGRTLARGESSPRVQLSSGRQVVTLLAAPVFLKADVTVEVPAGGEVALSAPTLGKLNARATPENCQVLVDDVFVDYPPIRDRPLAAGRHTVTFKWPDGKTQQQTIEVKENKPSFVEGRKE
jgi:eukaryotic-like serine/threonine-protein kinase